MFIIVNRFLVRRGFNGIALWPFIILKASNFKRDTFMMNHERIHIRQQAEMLIIIFYLWYGIEYLYRLIQYRNRFLAYRNISFEREAYKNENDLNYLKQRSFWGFLQYL